MKLRSRNLFFLMLVAFTIAALAVVPLQGAFAAHATKQPSIDILRPRIIAPRSTLLNAGFFGFGRNLIYHGGPVMVNQANVYAIFWEPTSSVSTGYNALIQRYFNDVGGSGLYHNDSQYSQTGGQAPQNSKFVNSVVDTTPYPESPLLDSDIQAEVSHEQSIHPTWTSSINNVFFVFLQKGEDLCFDPPDQNTCFHNIFCGYHSNFGNTLYAAIPYVNTYPGCNTPTSPNNNIDADSTINITSHEQNEAATDPLGTAWWDSQGNEIGDKCDFVFGPRIYTRGADVLLNGDPYIVQEEWDNHRISCVLSGP